jgi:putative SOS response-associated peptidase YedK
MCGRFNMTTDPLTRLFMALVGQPFPGGDRLNVAPTEIVPVIAAEDGERRIADMQWWLVPHWSKEPKTRYATFNARSEKMATSNAFRSPFLHRRCVVPVSGFYEWLTGPDGKKQPHYVVADDAEAGLVLAGLWDLWQGGHHHRLESFTLVTTAAHDRLSWLHDRQPVMLTQAEAETWLDADADPETLLGLCASRIAVPLAVVPTSPRMNNSRFKDAACLEAIGEARHLAVTGSDAEESCGGALSAR